MALDELYLAIAARLASIEEKIDAQGNMKGLIESALAALAMESQNAAAIADLAHRVALLESRLKIKSPPTTVV